MFPLSTFAHSIYSCVAFGRLFVLTSRRSVHCPVRLTARLCSVFSDVPPSSDPVFVPSRGAASTTGGGIVSPPGMSGGGIVRQPSPFEVQQTQYIRPGTAGGELIKAEYLYPAPPPPGRSTRATGRRRWPSAPCRPVRRRRPASTSCSTWTPSGRSTRRPTSSST